MSNLPFQPFKKLHDLIIRLPLLLHAVAAFTTFLILGFTNAALDESYAASRFPVPYAVGQTTFDGELLKSYYQVMLDAGTLDIYWRTQFIDFGFIGAMFVVGLFIPICIRRAALPATVAYNILTFSATAISTGAILDAIENLISFTMLAQPQTFPNWIALPYSAFAVMKFACIALGMLTLLVGILAVIIQRIARRRSARTS